MEKYKVIFHFGSPENPEQMVEADDAEKALMNIPSDGIHYFSDEKGRYFKVDLDKVLFISVEHASKAIAGPINAFR